VFAHAVTALGARNPVNARLLLFALDAPVSAEPVRTHQQFDALFAPLSPATVHAEAGAAAFSTLIASTTMLAYARPAAVDALILLTPMHAALAHAHTAAGAAAICAAKVRTELLGPAFLAERGAKSVLAEARSAGAVGFDDGVRLLHAHGGRTSGSGTSVVPAQPRLNALVTRVARKTALTSAVCAVAFITQALLEPVLANSGVRADTALTAGAPMLADAAAELASFALPLVDAYPGSATVDALNGLAPVDADALTDAVLASFATASVMRADIAAPAIATHLPPLSVRAHSRT
jgi:hypothetical protein